MRLLRRKNPEPLVLCCYTDLNPETERSVKQFAPNAKFVDTSENHFTYGKTIKEHWTGEQDLITVEHDLVLTPEVLPSFAACKEDWCTYAYQGPPHYGLIYTGLGCTRFSRKLQKRFSPFEDHFITYEMIWYFVDERIRRTLQTLNWIMPHVHGQIKHNHDYLDSGRYPFTEYVKERQPDERVFLYKNKPDGTRGEFIREVEKHQPWRR